MVQITNGALTLRVTKASFLSQYQPCGYTLVDSSEELTEEEVYSSSSESVGDGLGEVFQVESRDPEPAEVTGNEEEAAEAEEDEAEEEELRDLSEIPLSEMDFYQLCAYADQLGLDRKGLRSKKELRQLIRSNL